MVSDMYLCCSIPNPHGIPPDTLHREASSALDPLTQFNTLNVTNYAESECASPHTHHRYSATGAIMSLTFTYGLSEVADAPGLDTPQPAGRVRVAELLETNARLTDQIAAYQRAEATVASEYAHLLEQAKEMAAAEERTRLARDLHDSVTQTLYSASLITEVLPVVWRRNAAEGERNLVKLRQLVRGALAEMRTLLFELRPAALQSANLGVLLQQLGDVLTGHTRIPVSVTVEDRADPPTGVKIAAYRIAQEAFNNVAKHAGATQVTVTLHIFPKQLYLQVSDNGRGFDPACIPGERMGVRIMTERATSIGARLTVTSTPGQGTTVTLHWPDQPSSHPPSQ